MGNRRHTRKGSKALMCVTQDHAGLGVGGDSMKSLDPGTEEVERRGKGRKRGR